jgi:hypothetical protein
MVYAVRLGGNATHNWIGVVDIDTSSHSAFTESVSTACQKLQTFEDVNIYPMPDEDIISKIYKSLDRDSVLVTDSALIAKIAGG